MWESLVDLLPGEVEGFPIDRPQSTVAAPVMTKCSRRRVRFVPVDFEGQLAVDECEVDDRNEAAVQVSNDIFGNRGRKGRGGEK